MRAIYGLIVIGSVAIAAEAAQRDISATELIKLVSNGSYATWDVQVTSRLSGLRYSHLRFVPRAQDATELLAAMRNRALDMPARLCAARFLLDLNNAEAREFIHARLFGDEKPAMNNAAYALLDYVDEDPEKTWALDEMIEAIKDDRLVVKDGSSTTPGSDEFSEAFDDFSICLGRTKYRKADPFLLRALDRQPGSSGPAEALTELGDTHAVPLIIRAYPNNSNASNLLLNLGRLNTPQAVDFIIAHLDQWTAPKALAMTRSPKALPALQAYLERLKRADKHGRDYAHGLAAVRIAIVTLSHDNPSDALLSMAEDAMEDAHARGDALMAMYDFDSSALQARIIALYRKDPDSRIKLFCIRLLRDRKSDAVTAAMVEHALSIREMHSKDEFITADRLVSALNPRLGTSFDGIEELQSYLRHAAATRPASDAR